MPVLELIMRVIFSVHFAVAGSKGFFRLSLKNMLIVESLERLEQCDI